MRRYRGVRAITKRFHRIVARIAAEEAALVGYLHDVADDLRGGWRLRFTCPKCKRVCLHLYWPSLFCRLCCELSPQRTLAGRIRLTRELLNAPLEPFTLIARPRRVTQALSEAFSSAWGA